MALRCFLNGCYVGALVLYVLAGCRIVPFHGDEATIVYMSGDFATLFLHGDLAHIEYHDPPPADDPQAATKQQLRLINGVVNKYAYGLAWWSAGLTPNDLPAQWLWGADFQFNQATGRLPSDRLLIITRWASALLAAISVALVFAVGNRAGGPRTAYIAAFIYTAAPAILLNGRRAVFESGLLLFSALLIYLVQRTLAKPRGAISALMLGVAAGFAIASKHTGMLVAATVSSLALVPALKGRWRFARNGVWIAGGAAILALTVFVALNASWWSDPLRMPGRVLDARKLLLQGQVTRYGGFQNMPARIMALVREPFGAPQYYEDTIEDWAHWITQPIKTYDSSGLGGLSGSLWEIIIAILIIIGTIRALLAWRHSAVFVVLLWSSLMIATTFVLTPLDWQRYYVPIVAPLAVIGGMAFSVVGDAKPDRAEIAA